MHTKSSCACAHGHEPFALLTCHFSSFASAYGTKRNNWLAKRHTKGEFAVWLDIELTPQCIKFVLPDIGTCQPQITRTIYNGKRAGITQLQKF